MKKLLCAFLCILLLAGCEDSGNNENEFDDFCGYRAKIRAVVNDVTILADAEYDLLNGLIVTLRAPESVNGMIVKIKDGECAINFHELSFSFFSSVLPPHSPLISLERMGRSFCTVEECEGYGKLVCDNESYYLYADENGFYKLSTEYSDILYFDDFEIHNVQTQ